jgi:hypothetical protein
VHNQDGRPFAGLRELDATERRLEDRGAEGLQPLEVALQVAPVAMPHFGKCTDVRARPQSRIIGTQSPTFGSWNSSRIRSALGWATLSSRSLA